MAPRKDDPYDCISMQQGPATEKGLVNAEMLAALPHKKEADPPQDTSGIYTFLGLATVPRLGKANPRLHEIPRELVTHIAEFAHRPEYRCYWLGTANSTEGPACKVDVTRHSDVVLSMPPMRRGVHYVEINLGCAWCHTKICFEGVGQFFWLEFTEQETDELPPGAEDTWNTMCFKSFEYTMRELAIPASQYGFIPPGRTYCSEWWEWCEPVRVGLLVDMDRGCVTCRINGRYNTPCVRFPTFGWDPLGNGEDPRGASKMPLDKHPWTHNEHWRRGVQIVVRNFPDGPRLRQETDIRIPRCVVSCRTPNHPDLPSAALLVAAANPMTVAEHVEAGTLKVGRRDPNVPAELYGDDRSDLSDWEDY